MARGTHLHHWKVRLIETLEYKLLSYMQLGMRLEYNIILRFVYIAGNAKTSTLVGV